MSPRILIVLKSQDRKVFPLDVLWIVQTVPHSKINVWFSRWVLVGFFLFLSKHTCDLFHKYENASKNAFFFFFNNTSIDNTAKTYNMRSWNHPTDTSVSRGISLYTGHIPKCFCMATWKEKWYSCYCQHRGLLREIKHVYKRYTQGETTPQTLF